MATPAKEDDLKVPTSLHWSADDVANWIEEIGFPQYRDCFTSNLIDGRKLILVNASNLPRLGITDFDHILFITSSVREVVGLARPFWNVSVSDPVDTPMAMFLEKKSRTGPSIDKLTYSQYLRRS